MYQFLPAPNYAKKAESWVCIDNAFTEEQIKKIIYIGDALHSEPAFIGENEINENIRKCKTSWIGVNEDTKFIYDVLGDLVVKVNELHFGFNLFGFVERFQFTTYESDNNHYDWHMDRGLDTTSPRKLSVVLMLSDPEDYENGFLEFMPSANIVQTEKKLGRIFIFPSWMLHRVTAVTSGTRKSLVAWVAGPNFV